MTTDQKIDELMDMFREERALNNSRFTQLSTGLTDVRKEMGEMRVDMSKMRVELNDKIDKVYNSLSEDIQVFAEDLYQVKRRLTRLEKKSLPS